MGPDMRQGKCIYQDEGGRFVFQEDITISYFIVKDFSSEYESTRHLNDELIAVK